MVIFHSYVKLPEVLNILCHGQNVLVYACISSFVEGLTYPEGIP